MSGHYIAIFGCPLESYLSEHTQHRHRLSGVKGTLAPIFWPCGSFLCPRIRSLGLEVHRQKKSPSSGQQGGRAIDNHSPRAGGCGEFVYYLGYHDS